MDLSRWRKWRYALAFVITAAVAALLWAVNEKFPSPITMILFPVNGSPWEVGKLLFWPYLPGAVLLWRLSGAENRGSQCVLLLLMPLTVTALRCILGDRVPVWVLFAAVLLGGLVLYHLFLRRRLWGGELVWYVLAILLGIAYLLFTALPPWGKLFLPPEDVMTMGTIPF